MDLRLSAAFSLPCSLTTVYCCAPLLLHFHSSIFKWNSFSFPTSFPGNQMLWFSAQKCRSQLGLWKVCGRWTTLWPQKSSPWKKRNKATLLLIRWTRTWEAGSPCRTHRHTLATGHLWWCKAGEDRRRPWAVKSIVVLCSWYLGNPAAKSELWMKCRSEKAAVSRLDISWLKSLVLPVFVGPRPPKMHTHMLWVPAWCGAVGRVHKHYEGSQISFLLSQLLSFTHRMKTSLFVLPPKFSFFKKNSY